MPLIVYPNILEASRGLLIDVCRRLSVLQTNYVIVGGWVPYLRSRHATLSHPGTKDVDVLLNDQKVQAEAAVEALLSAEYLPSAKHPFQLLRPLKIQEGGGDRELVFNVDLMHSAEAVANRDMFADIMELDIYENYDPKQKRHVKSIIFPSSAIVFEQKLWSPFSLQATYPRGGTSTLNIPLVDEVALILSKCESATKKKRERDCYDIYYTLTASGGGQAAKRLRNLGSQFPQVQKQLDLLRTFIERDAGRAFDANTAMFVPGSVQRTSFAKVVSDLLFDVL